VPRVCIHEVVDVDGTRRTDYQHHMTANWVPEAGPLRRQRCFGVFSLVGSTGPWPCVVNIWEYDGWADLAHNFSVELAGTAHRDPMLAEWWERAATFRRGGHDRVLVADDSDPGVEHWQSRGGTGAVGYVHDVIVVDPGAAPEAAAEVASAGAAAMAGAGLSLVGLWRTAMRADDEVIALWGIPGWDAWADAEARAVWNRGVGRARPRTRHRWLLVDAELSPLRTGRQPQASDRRPLTG
jgi:hypothetical protein